MKTSENAKHLPVGFSARHLAWLVAVLGFATVPLQFADNWKVGAAAFWFSLLLLSVCSVLCYLQPRTTSKRFHPAAWSMVAAMAHLLLAHL